MQQTLVTSEKYSNIVNSSFVMKSLNNLLSNNSCKVPASNDKFTTYTKTMFIRYHLSTAITDKKYNEPTFCNIEIF